MGLKFLSHRSLYLNINCRNNHLFWTAIYNETFYIWRSNLDSGSNTIPLFDTGATSTQYGKDNNYYAVILNL